MNFPKKLAVTTSGVALMATMGAARATAASFNFSYSGDGATASGVLTTNPYAPATNSYQITGITGTRNGATIDSLLSPSSSFGNDNLLLASSTQLDQNGFSYTAGGQSYNISNTSDYFEIAGDFSSSSVNSFSATPVSVPEPSEGLGGILGMSVLIGGTWLKQKLK